MDLWFTVLCNVVVLFGVELLEVGSLGIVDRLRLLVLLSVDLVLGLIEAIV